MLEYCTVTVNKSFSG